MSLPLVTDFITAAWFFLFLALHFVIYWMDGWLVMGTGVWLKFLWFYCYRSLLGFLFEGDRDKFWESSCFTSSGFFEFVQKNLFLFGWCFLLQIWYWREIGARKGMERQIIKNKKKKCISRVGCMSMTVGLLGL